MDEMDEMDEKVELMPSLSLLLYIAIDIAVDVAAVCFFTPCIFS
jgi:hypothetical protein